MAAPVRTPRLSRPRGYCDEPLPLGGVFMELLPVPGEGESGGTLLGSEFGVVGGAVPLAGLLLSVGADSGA